MITEILQNLHPADRQLLMYAFNNNISQRVDLEDKKFIGVNILTDKIKVIEKVNKWIYGEEL